MFSVNAVTKKTTGAVSSPSCRVDRVLIINKISSNKKENIINFQKELSLCNKLEFSNPYIGPILWRKP